MSGVAPKRWSRRSRLYDALLCQDTQVPTRAPLLSSGPLLMMDHRVDDPCRRDQGAASASRTPPPGPGAASDYLMLVA